MNDKALPEQKMSDLGQGLVQRHLSVPSNQEAQLHIAFATDDQILINQHLGSCQSLRIYGLSPGSAQLEQVVEFKPIKGHSPQKIQARLKVLSHCFAVYCLACGDVVRKQLMQQGIRVIKLEHDTLINEQIQHIQQNWPTQLAQRLSRTRQRSKQRFSEFEVSEWDEEPIDEHF